MASKLHKSISSNNLTVTSLFSGCGGLDIGFMRAGYDLKWSNEINADAAKSYASYTKHTPVVEDIWNIIDKIPNADLVIGGPPCQAFSLVGKRLENDPRAKLVFAYAHVIEKLRPRAFVMENVPGLLASMINSRKLLDFLADNFTKLGYLVEILHLVATDFLVPQRRKRVVMVGIKKSSARKLRLISPNEFSKVLGMPRILYPVSVGEALDDLPSPMPKGSGGLVEYGNETPSPYAFHLRRYNNSGKVSLHTMPTMSVLDQEFVRHIPPGGNYMDIPDHISTIRIKKFKVSGGRTTTYGRLHPDFPAYTINTYFNRPNVGSNYHHREERLITVREALRLQSFPDDYIPYFKNQRSLHMQIGNAVPPLMAQGIAESLKEMLL